MKTKLYFLIALLGIASWTACSKDEETAQLPVVEMGIKDSPINGKVNETILFSAYNVNNNAYTQEWKLDDVVKSNAADYSFTPLAAGIYTIAYTASNSAGVFSYKYVVNVGVPTVPSGPGSSSYVNKVFEFLPGPGQYTNKTLGSMEGAKSLEGQEGAVSLGAWGGYIVLGFDHTVINEPEKDDLVIYANAQFNWAEPGVVWVMQDANANGKPDDTWYELKGSEFGKPGYIRNYEVTYTRPAAGGNVAWRDNKGNTGVVSISGAGVQAFPNWISGNEYTLKGSLLPSTEIRPGSLITSFPFAWGYADNAVGADQLDIANAIDAEGKTVSLSGIDFIKIQTGIQADLGILGELSTEIMGVADLGLIKKAGL